jgi:hypothetical protein
MMAGAILLLFCQYTVLSAVFARLGLRVSARPGLRVSFVCFRQRQALLAAVIGITSHVVSFGWIVSVGNRSNFFKVLRLIHSLKRIIVVLLGFSLIAGVFFLC